MFREPHQILAPGLKQAILNPRLRHMIQNKNLFRMTLYKLRSLRQVPLMDQDVVNQACIKESRNAAIEVVAKDKVIVGLILHNMTNALELATIRKRAQHHWKF